MNNLTEVYLMGLGVGENYVRCLVMSMGLGGAKKCAGSFKVIILRGKRASYKEETSFYGLTLLYTMKGVLTL